MSMGQAILETVLLAMVAFMTWRGLQTYGRRMEEQAGDHRDPTGGIEDGGAGDDPEVEAYNRRVQAIQPEPGPALNPDGELQVLRELDARMQAAFNEAVSQGKHLPDQFYCIYTHRGPVVWIYNPPYARQHFLEMPPYAEC